MYKKLIPLSFLLLFSWALTAEAQRVKTNAAPKSWAEAIADAKFKANEQLKKTMEPFATEPVKARTDVESFSVDITGLDTMVLVTWKGLTGRGDEQAAWVNPRLTAKDGSQVWLNDLKDSFVKDPAYQIWFNHNTRREPVKINGQGYENVIVVMANSQIIVPLDKKYTKFEAELGLDARSAANGKVVYRVQGFSGKDLADKIVKDYPEQTISFLNFGSNDMRMWITTFDSSVEEQVATKVVALLDDKTHFENRIENIKNEQDLRKRIVGFLDMAEDAMKIYRLQQDLVWLNPQAVEAAFMDMKNKDGFDVTANQAKLDELKQLTAKHFATIYTEDQEAIERAERALQLKKEILLSNPELDIDKLIVGRYKIGTSARQINPKSLGTQSNNWSNQTSSPRSGFDAEIVELSNLRRDIESRRIFKPENSSALPDLTLHWDADRLMFSMIDKDNKWQVYEVGLDGEGLKKLINIPEPDLEFFDATYLPSGKLLAVANIGYNGVPCVNGSDEVGNLCLYDPETGHLRRLTFDQDANWGPVVMNNGKVMYTRWEYTDLTHYFSRFVMHMNPDGTEQKSLYGSGSYFPNSTFDVKPIPGHPSRFIGVISGHHGVVRSGRLILFDPSKDRKAEKGMVQELPFKDRKIEPIVKDRLVDGVWPQFIKPYPLDDKYFVVAAKPYSTALWGIYLVDVFDNLTCIAEFEGEGLIHPTPVKKRPTPPHIPDRVNLDSKEATVFIQDIYEGEGLPGVPRGTVKALRVLAYEYAYNKTASDHIAQGIQSGWDIKRLLGIVPVEEDGSVLFTIPANTPISLQPLDENGAAIQWMRSWLTGMPGETVSCIGCHEDQNNIPIPKRVIASNISAHKIKEPEGGVRSFTFDLEVQPILDRACIACHNADGPKPDFRGGRTDKATGFGESYLSLHPYIHRQGPEAAMEVLVPYEYHANVSPLVKLLKTGHYGVELTQKEWETLYNWIDFNAPYHGTFKANRFKGMDQIARRTELADKYANAGVDWQAEIKAYADYLSQQPEIVPERPTKQEYKFKEVKQKGWPFNKEEAVAMQAHKEKKSVEIAPGITMNFVWIPAGSFVMGKNEANSDYYPAHKQAVKKGFWMGEIEVSNEQFRAIFPEHDSRQVDQQWKDHVHGGYPANKDEQPAIRVSWQEAMEYCNKLSERTGLKINLPTEAQWEWAARAGSDSDFWYGAWNADFAMYENMADKQMNKLAVRGVNPQPMSENDPLFKYYTYHPKLDYVDDGHMIMASGASFEHNPWGLYDINGNVAEWTRSDYLPYPYKDNGNRPDKEKVVRGGSWKDHPKTASHYYRKAYLPWQKVHNVGFRVIIEE